MGFLYKPHYDMEFVYSTHHDTEFSYKTHYDMEFAYSTHCDMEKLVYVKSVVYTGKTVQKKLCTECSVQALYIQSVQAVCTDSVQAACTGFHMYIDAVTECLYRPSVQRVGNGSSCTDRLYRT